MRRLLLLVLIVQAGILALARPADGTGAADKEVPPEVLNDLASKQPSVRIKAIKALSKLGIEAVPPLVKALRDEETQVSKSAAYALGLLKVAPKALVKALEPHLKDDTTAVRFGVTVALGKGGPAAVPALGIALADKETTVRRYAVLSLEMIVKKNKKAGKEVLAVLAKGVADSSASVRVELARALSHCGPDALPPTLALADDTDARVRAYALAGLGGLKPPAEKVLPILAKRAKEDPEVIVRQSALSTLGKLGKEWSEPLPGGLKRNGMAGKVVAVVVAALADKEPAVQKMAVRALVAIGPEAHSAIRALKESALKAENPDVRSVAVAALGRMGKEGEEALLAVLGRDDSVTRMACLQHLGKKGAAPKSAVADLIKALTDKDPEVRILSAHVLGLIGTDAKAALPALEKARKDEDPRVVSIAEKTIKKIKGE